MRGRALRCKYSEKRMKMDLLSLPVVMVENIFSYLSYDEIARVRVVCKGFNEVCMRMLNRGFLIIERRHALALKSVKTQLPRRESERRHHPLSRHCDILTSIETRISMLNMTYSKYIDTNLCCFIPGKVIDEIKRVLTEIETSKTTPRAHEVLQELRDISSMAIEHFDDKISPAFRKRLQEGVAPPQPRPAQAVLAPIAMRQEVMNLRRYSKLNAKLSLYLAEQYKGFFKRMLTYKKIAFKQRKCIRELQKKQRHQDASIADLKKRIEECDIKYSEITHTNQAAGGKTKSSNDSSSQGLRHFGSQIKLDLSVLPIGTSKRNQTKSMTSEKETKLKRKFISLQQKNDILDQLNSVPNIKPRKSQIRLPNLSNDNMDGPTFDSKPSTSGERALRPLRSKTQSSQTPLAKVRGLTKEIQQLSNITFPVKIKGMTLKSSLTKKSPNVTIETRTSLKNKRLNAPVVRNVPEVKEKEAKKRKNFASDMNDLSKIKKLKLD